MQFETLDITPMAFLMDVAYEALPDFIAGNLIEEFEQGEEIYIAETARDLEKLLRLFNDDQGDIDFKMDEFWACLKKHPNEHFQSLVKPHSPES